MTTGQPATRLAKGAETPPPRPRTPTGVPRTPATVAAPEPTSLVVLPITCAPEDAYLADGLREDLIDTLCATPGLRVRPAGAVSPGESMDPRDVGRRLAVDHVAVASLRRTPKGLRVTTRLISVADGFQIWANKADCTDAEVLEVAGEIAAGIAEALSTHAATETRPTDPRAVDLYLRARAELRRFWGVHAQNAAALLEQAVDIAPGSPPILAAAAYAHVQAWVMRGEPDQLPGAERALQRGMSTGHGEAYLASAQYHFNKGNLVQGAQDLARALVHAPMSAQTHELAAKILVEIEGTAPARLHFETARGLDPGRANVIDNDLTRVDALDQKWDDAYARNERLRADPDVSIQQLGEIQRARLEMWRGNSDVILVNAKGFLARVSPNAGAIFKLVEVLQQNGAINGELWRSVITAPPDPLRPQRQYLVRLQIFCEIAIALKDRERALEALMRLDELGFMDKTWIHSCPLLSSIVDDPRYNTVRKSVSARAADVLAAFRAITA